MPETFTLYERLGVSRTASFDDIKRAYHANAAAYHPDVNSAPNSEVMMAMLNEAWQILSDPTRREQYDKSLGGAPQSSPGARGGSAAAEKRAAGKAAETRHRRAAQRQAEEDRIKKAAAEAIEHRRKIAEEAKRERQRLRILGIGGVLFIAAILLWLRFSSLTSAAPSQSAASPSSGLVDVSASPTLSTNITNSGAIDHRRRAPVGRTPVEAASAQRFKPEQPLPVRAEHHVAETIPISTGPTITIKEQPAKPLDEQEASQTVTCTDQQIELVKDNGAALQTSTGKAYAVSDQGTMQIEVRSWSTGDDIAVCTAGSSASITDRTNLNEKVQAAYAGTAVANAIGCDDHTIERVKSDGSGVDTSDGISYAIPDQGTMQIEVRSWSTGDSITVCKAGPAASIADHDNLNEKVQAMYAGPAKASSISCSEQKIIRVTNDGALVNTSSGAEFAISDQGTMQIEVRSWSTGDTITVCNAGTSASITDHDNLNEKVQATRT